MAVTKPHKTSQRMAYKPLALEQENAVDLLVLGKSDREVAESLGLARETVTRWRHEHPVFIAELNRRRNALWTEAHDRLRTLVGKAVDILEQAVAGGDLKAAVEVLKIVKLHGEVPPPNGPEDPELVLWQQAEAWAVAELQREGPAEDPALELLVQDGKQARLARQRFAELRQALEEVSPSNTATTDAVG
jgi:hypothetical protein